MTPRSRPWTGFLRRRTYRLLPWSATKSKLRRAKGVHGFSLLGGVTRPPRLVGFIISISMIRCGRRDVQVNRRVGGRDRARARVSLRWSVCRVLVMGHGMTRPREAGRSARIRGRASLRETIFGGWGRMSCFESGKDGGERRESWVVSCGL